jgi:hypothetical protein
MHKKLTTIVFRDSYKVSTEYISMSVLSISLIVSEVEIEYSRILEWFREVHSLQARKYFACTFMLSKSRIDHRLSCPFHL